MHYAGSPGPAIMWIRSEIRSVACLLSTLSQFIKHFAVQPTRPSRINRPERPQLRRHNVALEIVPVIVGRPGLYLTDQLFSHSPPASVDRHIALPPYGPPEYGRFGRTAHIMDLWQRKLSSTQRRIRRVSPSRILINSLKSLGVRP